MKIHFGCGERYLAGYVNIDFPPKEHSVQEKSVADVHADLLVLRYPAESVEEVRLHHVFEHFPRPIACALLTSWHSWLCESGVIHIEVPDLTRTVRTILNPLASLKKQAVAERHLFGSHEAHWAVHCEGYTTRLLESILNANGFSVRMVQKNKWQGTYNLEVIACKSSAYVTRRDLEASCRKFLANFLVNDSEEKLLDIWMNMYRAQLESSWASNA